MIAVTGATGHLGRLAVKHLLARGVTPSDVVAVVRSPEKAADLAALGVTVREGDYTKPETLETAFAGVDRLLLVSGSELGQRVAQHSNAVEAAAKAGVASIVYTSAPFAATTTMLLAAEHKGTEELIRESGLTFTFLRNGWYVENYTGALAQTLERGVMTGAGGTGRVSAAPRSDYAEAAAAVLTGSGHENAVYELGGDQSFTLAEAAATISEVSGTTVVYSDVPVAEYASTLEGFGLPAPVAAIIADSDGAIARGELFTDSGDLSRLIGHPTGSFADAVRAAL